MPYMVNMFELQNLWNNQIIEKLPLLDGVSRTSILTYSHKTTGLRCRIPALVPQTYCFKGLFHSCDGITDASFLKLCVPTGLMKMGQGTFLRTFELVVALPDGGAKKSKGRAQSSW